MRDKGEMALSSPRLVVPFIVPLALAGVAFSSASARAETKPPMVETPQEQSAPAEASLTVGALQIGSVANLEVAGFEIAVTTSSIAYTYQLKNNGAADLTVAATITLPELSASVEGTETWTLAKYDAENFVDLTVTAAGAPVSTKTEMHASALGIDRLAEIKAANLPLIPFGPDSVKALAALSPESAARLAALGIISPRDPAQPKAALTADWSLDVVRNWSQVLPAAKTTPIVVKFVPVAAHYRLTKADADDLNDVKDELCLKPPALTTLQARMKGNGSWNVTDIALADDAPARWIESPAATIAVQKPKPDAIVTFCGMDEKSAGKSTVVGTAPDSNEGIRVVIFEPAK
jgi:Domain of unknown function (DUF4424)